MIAGFLLIRCILRSRIDTSRPPRVLEENGKNYWFLEREEMEQDIRDNKFLEYGEYNGNLYGTHLDSIRDVIRQGMHTKHIIISFFLWF